MQLKLGQGIKLHNLNMIVSRIMSYTEERFAKCDSDRYVAMHIKPPGVENVLVQDCEIGEFCEGDPIEIVETYCELTSPGVHWMRLTSSIVVRKKEQTDDTDKK